MCDINLKGSETYLLELVYWSVFDVDVDSLLEVEVFVVEVDDMEDHIEDAHIRVLLDRLEDSVAALCNPLDNHKQVGAMVYTPSQQG
jgi:hypothetical protein